MTSAMRSLSGTSCAAPWRVAAPLAWVLASCVLVFGCSSGELSAQDATGFTGTQPCRRYNSAQRVNARGKRHISVDGFDERHCVTPTMSD